MEVIKRLKDVEKLCKVENFIISNGRPLTEQDKDMLYLIEDVMEDYTYGWYIYKEGFFNQLKSINEFKVYILGL